MEGQYHALRSASGAVGSRAIAVAAVPVGGIAVLCDAYGGQIGNVPAADTAFPRRGGTQYCIQYFSSWQNAANSASHIANVANVYAAMRPYLSGAAYVNYCDLDLRRMPTGVSNLPRTTSVPSGGLAAAYPRICRGPIAFTTMELPLPSWPPCGSTPLRSATFESFLSAAFSSLRLVFRSRS